MMSAYFYLCIMRVFLRKFDIQYILYIKSKKKGVVLNVY